MPKNSPHDVLVAAEALHGESNDIAFLQHLADDLRTNGVEGEAFRDALDLSGIIVPSPLELFAIPLFLPLFTIIMISIILFLWFIRKDVVSRYSAFSTESLKQILSVFSSLVKLLSWVQKGLLSQRRKEEPPFINLFPRRTDIECVEDLRKRPSTYLSGLAISIMKGQIFFRVESLLKDFQIRLPKGWTPEKVTEKALTEKVQCLSRLLNIYQALRCVERGVCTKEEFSIILTFIKDKLEGAEWDGERKGDS